MRTRSNGAGKDAGREARPATPGMDVVPSPLSGQCGLILRATAGGGGIHLVGEIVAVPVRVQAPFT